MSLTAEELLAGGALTHTVEIPPEFLPRNGSAPAEREVMLRPLTVRALQRIAKAARDDDTLSASLMIQQSLVEPTLKFDEVAQLPAGLARFLVERINTISGIDTPRDELAELVQAPLAKACFVLAREFGWTPEEVSGMTIGQILLYLEMAQGSREAA
ncbi:MAG: hypothetical protein IPM39_04310 [Chloroflexi bacterium]|nr:hypothetical protein [Chloroflexota bacterium]